MSADRFTHPEKALARSLGLSQRDLRTIRDDTLERGRDWQTEHGEVRYSADGVTRLCASLKISPPDGVLPAPAPESPAADLSTARTALLQTLLARPLLPEHIGAQLAHTLTHSAPKNSSEPASPPVPLAPPGPSAPGGQPAAVTPAASPTPPDLGPPRPGDQRELVCVRTYPLNRRIVLATLGTAEVRVRLRDSANLRPGMRLTCRFLQADLWELATRCPRFPGKW
jgi:hypothetical protein